MTETEFKLCSPNTDLEFVNNFLWSLREELFFTERHAVEKLTDQYFQHGGVLGGFKEGGLIAALGFFYGDPNHNFQDKQIGFISSIAIAKEQRMSWLAFEGTRFMIETFRHMGIENFRFHALSTDSYTNRMYSLITSPVRQEVNGRGFLCNVYDATFKDFERLFDRMGGRVTTAKPQTVAKL